ncbi:MAG: glycosyltransferase family 2 protein [Cyclobacteriaceae bacterium]
MKPLISIGLGTRDRPKMLEQVLESLTVLNLPEAMDVELIVCDNGSSSDTITLVEKIEKQLSFKATLLKEEQQGITYMRNRILRAALDNGAAFLAFIDDDEVVNENWLKKLIEAKIQFAADVVQGHVEQHFPEVPHLDLLKKFFPGSFETNTGDQLKDAYTNNVLFDLTLVRQHGLKFNERFNLTGGSDSFFFSQLQEKGARIVFTREAIVTETIPVSRANLDWVRFRFYRNGYTKYLMDVVRLGKIRAFGKGLKTISKTAGNCMVRNKTRMQPSVEDLLLQKKCLRTKGIFHAMIGKSFAEYDVIHGN